MNELNKAQIEWLNNYCKENGDEVGFFTTNAGNLGFIYRQLNKLETDEESEQEKLQRHGENDEPEQVDNGQQHYEDMKTMYD